MAGGRPTKYTKDMPGKVYDYMAQGHSITEFAVFIGVNLDTVYEWAKVHAEFSEALKDAKVASQVYWEGRLKEMMTEQGVNSPLVKLYFANRFGWHDKQDTNIGGQKDNPLRVEHGMSDDELKDFFDERYVRK